MNKEYFVWDPTHTGGGKYSVSMRHPFIEKIYGVSKKKSKLNKNSILKHNTIIEIDTKRIDIQNDSGYKELKRDRDTLYAKQALRNVFDFWNIYPFVSILCVGYSLDRGVIL